MVVLGYSDTAVPRQLGGCLMGALVEFEWFRLPDPLDALAEVAALGTPSPGRSNEPPARRGPRIGRGEPVIQVRGVLAERVVISTELDPWMNLRALASYSGLSVRNLRDRLKDQPDALPCHRIGGKVLVRRSDYDAWAARFRQVGDPDLDRVVAEALRDVRRGPNPRRVARVA